MEEARQKQNIRLGKKEIAIIVFGLILVVGALAWAIDVVQNRRVVPKTNQNKVATASAKPYCQEGVVYENKKQGYSLCLTSVDEVKDTSKTQNSTSLNLPLKSVFVATQSAKGATASASLVSIETAPPALVEVSSNLDIVSTKTLRVGETDGQSVIYNTPKKAGFRTQVVSVTKFKRHFSLKFTSTVAKFSEDSVYFNSLVENFKFLPGTSDPPWTTKGSLIVDFPWPGDTIDNPVVVRGKGEVFEAVINLRVKDKEGNILISTTTNTAVGQELSNFSKALKYKKPKTKEGGLEVFTISPKDGTEQDKINIPIIFSGVK